MTGVMRHRLRRLLQLFAGIALVCAFFGLDRTSNTIQVEFVPPWDASVRGELYFWLGAIIFLLPGATLVGVSASELAGPWLERAGQRLTEATGRDRRAVVFALFAIAWAAARLGNQLVLHGQPFTDDEDAVRFGGQVLATGRLWAPLPPMRFAFPDLFLFQRAGHWTSFDFLGAIAAWTLAEWTRSETLVFSLLAALPAPAVACAVMRKQGLAQGLGAGLLMLCSPMALTLSMTSHTHVVSRGLLAVGLGVIAFVEHASFARSLAAGTAFGLAFATRPPETCMLLTPLMAHFAYEAWRDARERSRLLGLALGALPGVGALFAYDYALTGSLGFPRSAPNEISVPYGAMMHGWFAFSRWSSRFGNNLAYNTLTLSIWFLGLVGLPLAWLGARASRTHALLGCGVLLTLMLCMLHDDRGLHMVGPIHLSETAVPLAILAAAGFARAVSALAKLAVPPATTWLAALGYAGLGLVIFSGWHARALEEQALTRIAVVSFAEDVPQRPAIVLAKSFASLRSLTPYKAGGFVFEWRRARPDLSDPVLIVLDSPAARREVERAFPDRTAYVLDPQNFGASPVPLAEVRQSSRASP